ncbi:MAG: hypothetical protein WA816_07640 [Bacteroidales bacterium]
MKALITIRNLFIISSLVIISSSFHKEELKKHNIPSTSVNETKVNVTITDLGSFGSSLQLIQTVTNKPGC